MECLHCPQEKVAARILSKPSRKCVVVHLMATHGVKVTILIANCVFFFIEPYMIHLASRYVRILCLRSTIPCPWSTCCLYGSEERRCDEWEASFMLTKRKVCMITQISLSHNRNKPRHARQLGMPGHDLTSSRAHLLGMTLKKIQ